MYNIKRGLIVSVQDTIAMHEQLIMVSLSDAVAVRTALGNLQNSAVSDCPVIGLTKRYINGKNIITPSSDDVDELLAYYSDYIAVELSGYGMPLYELEKLLIDKKCAGKIICDIHRLDNALQAQEMGASAVTTALSGYRGKNRCNQFDPPDLKLVEKCVEKLDIPVIAEGRYWTIEQIEEAFKLGAHSVCVGAAITRPDLIAKRFIERIKKCISI